MADSDTGDGYGNKPVTMMLSQGYPSNHFTAQAGKLLAQAAQAVAASDGGMSGEAFLYGANQGSLGYREEVAKFLSTEYGEPVHSDSIQVTAGATQGLHFVTSLFMRSGDIVFVEDPTYFIAINILRKDLGMTIVPVPTDNEGIDVDALEKLIVEHCSTTSRPVTKDRPFTSMVYTIPTFHNPTGRCLSQARCQRLVDLGHKHNIMIVCDDVYNLLHYGDDPVPRRLLSYEKEMYGEKDGNVISIGTFSKILCPAIRVGWIESCTKLISLMSLSSIAFSGGSFNHYGSHLVGHLLHTGLEQRMVEDMRTEHTSRVKAVNAILAEKLPAEVKYVPPKGGYFYWLELPEEVDMQKVTQIAADKGVSFVAGQSCSPSEHYGNCIRFSISKYKEPELVTAVTCLCQAIIQAM